MGILHHQVFTGFATETKLTAPFLHSYLLIQERFKSEELWQNIPHGRPKNGARDTDPQHISPPNIEKFTIRILAVCGKRGKIDMVSQSVDKDKKALNRSPSSILDKSHI